MFQTAEDDDDFMTPTTSNLSSLFGAPTTSSNNSLKYVAPKEPKKAKPEQVPANKEGTTQAVLFATPVQTYKFVNGSYASQGKAGAAILGHHQSNNYKLLVYVSKQQQLTHATISPSFTLTIQDNNYASFYDDGNNSWSVMFDSELDIHNFAKHVCIAKFYSTPNSTELLIQNVANGQGGLLQAGDSVEVKYTAWLIENKTIGKVCDSNADSGKLLRFKVGKCKVIKGLDDGVLGMKHTAKRFLVVPAALGYSSKGLPDKVPPNSTLLYYVEVIRVKLASKTTDSATTSASSSPVMGQTAALDASTNSNIPEDKAVDQDESIKARSKSIEDNLQHSTQTDKAKLISRMARMGQPMLASLTSAQTEHTEDEETSQVTEAPPSPHKPGIAPKPPALTASSPKADSSTRLSPIDKPVHTQDAPTVRPTAQHVNSNGQVPYGQPFVPSTLQGPPGEFQMSVYQNPMPIPQQPFTTVPGVPSQYPTMYPQPTPTAQTDGVINNLMSETRQQNTELRLSVTRVADKIDLLTNKFDNQLHSTQNSALATQQHPNTMDPNLLLHSIQKIVQENERMKQEIEDNRKKIEAQNEKISDLLYKSQKYMEKSTVLMEERNETLSATTTQSQGKILALEQEKVKLTYDLNNTQLENTRLQQEVLQQKSLHLGISERLNSSVLSNTQLQEQIDSLKNNASAMLAELTTVRTQHQQEAMKCEKLSETVQSLERELVNKEQEIALLKKQQISSNGLLASEKTELTENFEAEIKYLKEQLAEHANTTDSNADEKLTAQKIELTEENEEKLKCLQKEYDSKHALSQKASEDEKKELKERLEQAQQELTQSKESLLTATEKLESVTSATSESTQYQEKYQEVCEELTSLKQQFEAQGNEKSTNPDDLNAEIKRVMNTVFHSLKAEFNATETYDGDDIHSTVLNTIKNVTLKMTEQDEESEESSSGSESSDDEQDTRDQDTDEQKTNEQHTDEQKTDEQITDEQITDEQITDEQLTDEQKTDEQIIECDVESTDKHDLEEVKNENVDMTEKQIDNVPEDNAVTHDISSDDDLKPSPPPMSDDDNDNNDEGKDNWMN